MSLVVPLTQKEFQQVFSQPSIILFFNVLFIFERERESKWWWWGEQKEREAQTLKQAPGSELSAQTLMQGLNHKLRDHDLSQSR